MSILKKLIEKFYRARIKFSKVSGMGITIISNTKNTKARISFFSLDAVSNTGKNISLENYKNKKILVVNLASKCGFTPQYEELEKLHNLYKDIVTILGFPSDDFGGQEPGSDEEIAEFCKINYGVTFPLFHKDHVKGVSKQSVYQWLSDPQKNGWNADEPTWNFCKYLIDENGDLQYFFSSAVSPMDEVIVKALEVKA